MNANLLVLGRPCAVELLAIQGGARMRMLPIALSLLVMLAVAATSDCIIVAIGIVATTCNIHPSTFKSPLMITITALLQ
jgi:hypothetical protein